MVSAVLSRPQPHWLTKVQLFLLMDDFSVCSVVLVNSPRSEMVGFCCFACNSVVLEGASSSRSSRHHSVHGFSSLSPVSLASWQNAN